MSLAPISRGRYGVPRPPVVSRLEFVRLLGARWSAPSEASEWLSPRRLPYFRLMLLSCRVEPGDGSDDNDSFAILAHALKTAPGLVRFLLALLPVSGCDRCTETALHIAAEFAPACIPALVDAGAPVDARNVRGETPLHVAAESARALGDTLARGAIRNLLAAGASADARDIRGETPLHFAVRWGEVGVAGLLLAGGASPDAADLFDRSPLHLAARRGMRACVRMLLGAGDVGAGDVEKSTPPHAAAIVKPHWRAPGEPSAVEMTLAAVDAR